MNYCDAMSCSDNSIVVVMAVVLMARVVLHSRQKIYHLAIPTITNTDEILENNILGIMTLRMHLPTSIDYATVMICNYMYIYKDNFIVIVLCSLLYLWKVSILTGHLVFRFLSCSVPSTLWWG